MTAEQSRERTESQLNNALAEAAVCERVQGEMLASRAGLIQAGLPVAHSLVETLAMDAETYGRRRELAMSLVTRLQLELTGLERQEEPNGEASE
jgi:hypothetical protein